MAPTEAITHSPMPRIVHPMPIAPSPQSPPMAEFFLNYCSMSDLFSVMMRFGGGKLEIDGELSWKAEILGQNPS